MRKPKLLDLFCCEGGAGAGYERAGFEVYGVDIEPQPRFPFAFHQGDALDVLRELIRGDSVFFTRPDGTTESLSLSDFSLIHASPPCQAFSITKHSHSNEHPDLLTPSRVLLLEAGLPYIIENVPGAPMLDPLVLCGSMFGLRAVDTDGTELALRRHRLFETSFPLFLAPSPCVHDSTIVGGSYGGGWNRTPEQRDGARKGGYTPAADVRAALIGADWMSLHGLSQSIPTAYSEWLGREFLSLELEAARV